LREIKLTIEDKNFDTILNILENLKDGLITTLNVDGQSTKQREPIYKAKLNTIIREEESATNDKNGKYASPSAYKQRLNKKK